jgi:hypothetical protein
MSNDWPIPADLSPLGKKAAEVIHQFFVDNDLTNHGGGGRFYSPQEWKGRDESYGLDSLLVITHDGGAHAAAFNIDYECYDLMEELREKLAAIGVFSEKCTSWYSAVYK